VNPESDRAAETETPSAATARYAFIDGLRGLVAFVIVLTHIVWEVCPRGDVTSLPPLLAAALLPIAFANKVAIFLVISGYCLGLSVARRPGLQLRGGSLAFLRRRFRRVLPPYYTAMALFLLLIWLVPVMGKPSGVRWDVALPAFDTGVILSHLFMVHNYRPDWLLKIDPPMWSLAIEWQLYLVFLGILIPLWRRWGVGVAAGFGLLVGYLPHFLLPPERNFDWTAPWYLGMFCLGMAASAIPLTRAVHEGSRVGLVLLGIVILYVMARGVVWAGPYRPFIDLVVGLWASCLMAYGASAPLFQKRSRMIGWLETKPLQRMGSYSYHLYLIHFPLLSLLHAGLRVVFPDSAAGQIARLFFLFLAGVPMSLGAGYLFHRLFERPGGKARTVSTEQDAPALPRSSDAVAP
jgi:peptidoglycan/LPS O-acetylase OafA/YrhL